MSAVARFGGALLEREDIGHPVERHQMRCFVRRQLYLIWLLRSDAVTIHYDMTTTANIADDHCDCEVHGHQPITFVCTHIVSRTLPDTAGFVSFSPEDEDDLRDAWCEVCDAYMQNNGGEWIEDTVEVPGGITIICAECYRQREADARLAGRRTIRDG